MKQKHRDFVAMLGGAAAWPARSQQALPLIGVLGSGASAPLFTRALLERLKETGHVGGQNVAAELLINLKAAKALRLDVPAPLLATADEVIE